MLLATPVDLTRLFFLLALNGTISPAVLPAQRQHEVFALVYLSITGDASECNKAGLAIKAEFNRVRTELTQGVSRLKQLRTECAEIATAIVPDLQRLENIQKQMVVLEKRLLELNERRHTLVKSQAALNQARSHIRHLRRVGQ